MKKCYLIVVCIENILYIQLTKGEEGHALHAFHTLEEALVQFDGFRQKAVSGSYEAHISGSMGILNLRPEIIEVDMDNPQLLAPYLIENKPFELRSNVFGAHVNLVGVPVKEEILELSVCDVAKKYIAEAYEPA